MDLDHPHSNRVSACDLDWWAFRYLSSELSPDEVEHFESQLGDDQAAREAVARAVEWLQAAVFVETELGIPSAEAPHSARTRWLEPVAWLTLGAAACVTALVIADRWSESPGPGRVATGSPDGGHRSRELAQAWQATRAALDGIPDLWPEPASDEWVDDLGSARFVSAGDDEPLSPWILAAVAGLSGQPAEDDSGDPGQEL